MNKKIGKIALIVGGIYCSTVVVNMLVADMINTAEDESILQLSEFINNTPVEYTVDVRDREFMSSQEVGQPYIAASLGVWRSPEPEKIIVRPSGKVHAAIIIKDMYGGGVDVRISPVCDTRYPTYYLRRGPNVGGQCAVGHFNGPASIEIKRNADFDEAEQGICPKIHRIAYCGGIRASAKVVFDEFHATLDNIQDFELVEHDTKFMTIENVTAGDQDE